MKEEKEKGSRRSPEGRVGEEGTEEGSDKILDCGEETHTLAAVVVRKLCDVLGLLVGSDRGTKIR